MAGSYILGSLAGRFALRNFAPMRNFLHESLSLRMDIGDKGGIAWCLRNWRKQLSWNDNIQKRDNFLAAAAALPFIR